MATQRAVIKGSMLDLVQIRSMFTANVVESGGDTAEMLWDVYLDQLYAELEPVLSNNVTFQSRELQNYSGGSWVTFDEDAVSWAGTSTTMEVPNSVSAVLIAKTAALRTVGRKFIGGLTVSSIAGNAIDSGALAVVAAALVLYLAPVTGIGGGTLTPGVVDKSGTFHAFVGGFVSSFMGSMRRRKPGQGI